MVNYKYSALCTRTPLNKFECDPPVCHLFLVKLQLFFEGLRSLFENFISDLSGVMG